MTEDFRPTKKIRKIKESAVEEAGRLFDKAEGGVSYKFVSPARRAVPDRLRLRPIPPEHREIVAKYIRFTEYKRPGEKPTPEQQREHAFLRSFGFTVDVIDNINDAKNWNPR